MPTVVIDTKAKTITITLHIEEALSSTKKSVLIANTHGFLRTEERYNGLPVSINVTATIPHKA